MTIQELKNLKVGQLVRYTDSCDPLHVEFWTLASMSEGEWLMFWRTQCNNSTIIGLDDPGLHLIASELEIAQLPIVPDSDRQLRLIEAKIKDIEFKINYLIQLRVAHIIDQDYPESNSCDVEVRGYFIELDMLIEQRNALICP